MPTSEILSHKIEMVYVQLAILEERGFTEGTWARKECWRKLLTVILPSISSERQAVRSAALPARDPRPWKPLFLTPPALVIFEVLSRIRVHVCQSWEEEKSCSYFRIYYFSVVVATWAARSPDRAPAQHRSGREKRLMGQQLPDHQTGTSLQLCCRLFPPGLPEREIRSVCLCRVGLGL